MSETFRKSNNKGISKMSIIYEFKKNSNEKLAAAFTEYKGKKLFDLRVYYNAGDERLPDWKFTRKGISVLRELIPEIKEAMDKALEEYEKSVK
jgi:hypothetical protein